MIKFDHNNGDLRYAVFGGNLTDLVADLCLEMTLIYGAMKSHNDGLAAEFKRNMLMCMIDPDIADKVFSTEIYDQISKDTGHYFSTGTISVGDREEFEKQLKELLNESE